MSGIVAATSSFRLERSISDVVDVVVQVRVVAGVQRAQRVIAGLAEQNCPRQSGDLAGSIHPTEIINTGKEIVGSVVADAAHAGFVEFGTGLVGAGTYPFPLPTEGVPYTGEWVYDYRNQGWKGQAAQPFLRPALDIGHAEILEAFSL